MGFSLNMSVTLAVMLVFGTWACQVSSRVLSEETMLQKHEQWMARFGRVYRDNQEREMRFKIFKNNVAYIEEFNSGNQAYNVSVNKFADLTNDEFKATRNGFKFPSTLKLAHTKPFRYEDLAEIPPSMDWRTKGAVTPVKDQGSCGSCWAFSTIAATEGITEITTGKLISLSEQELIDCDKSSEDHGGCEGGSMVNGFEFIVENKGINTEAAYPYQGADGTCNTKEEAVHAATISGYENVPTNDESALLKAVAMQPVSVAIDAGESDFQFYSSGVFNGTCGTELDHGVTAVGYGTSDDGIKYWLVKNSWGTSWGEEGYIRMQRDVEAKEGLCGIAMMASYPTA